MMVVGTLSVTRAEGWGVLLTLGSELLQFPPELSSSEVVEKGVLPLPQGPRSGLRRPPAAPARRASSGRFGLLPVAPAHYVLTHACARFPVALLHVRLHSEGGHGAGAAVRIQGHEVQVAYRA